MQTDLCKIMTDFGSDKGRGHHNYTIYYDSLFNKLKEKELQVFELGLGTNNLDVKSNMGSDGKPGASLRGWKNYFPNSYIYGADIDSRILFEEDRIKTFHCDQTNVNSINEMWNNQYLKNLYFDIIIEDGLHEFYANLIFLENSIHKLKPGGYYICEDLTNKTVESFEKIIKDLEKKFTNCNFIIEKIKHEYNFNDNNLLVIYKN
jgi:hypothetical protein